MYDRKYTWYEAIQGIEGGQFYQKRSENIYSDEMVIKLVFEKEIRILQSIRASIPKRN